VTDATAALLNRMTEFPLHQHLGFELVEARDGIATGRCSVGPNQLNAGGVLHGGVLYALLDITSYCAAVTVLPPGRNVVTHDLHVQVLRHGPPGSQIHFAASVRKAGKRVMFLDCEAHLGDADGPVLALARVTKSLVPMPVGA